MKINLEIDQAFIDQLNPSAIETALQTASQILDNRLDLAATVTVTITGVKTIQQLNQTYRGLNIPTDVLSFAHQPDPDFPVADPAMAAHLGDIVIAYPVAMAQAKAAGHAPQEEVILLAIHGLLHLLDLDHDSPERKTKMWRLQQQILTQLGLDHIAPTES